MLSVTTNNRTFINMHIRPRRNRKSATVRNMVRETRLSTDNFIFPLFLLESSTAAIEVSSMPGIYRLGLDKMLKEIDACMKVGVNAFDIFHKALYT